MELSTILYITLALILASGLAFFQYLYRRTNKKPKDYLFFVLRSLSLFLVGLLLINPKIRTVEYEVERPELTILADNSQSVAFLGEADKLRNFYSSIVNDKKIQDRFDINRMQFGEELSLNDSLDFSALQTDIFSALSDSESLKSKENSVILLLTDGNQSLGRDFRYFKAGAGREIIPVIIGDTTKYKDLSIGRINVNRYAFINNRFPVEVFVNYSGTDQIDTDLNIKAGGKIVFNKRIRFSSGSPSEIIRTELPANSLGVKTYQVEIAPVSGEKNVLNNVQNFGIEVIDERTSVLILSDLPHPDLGALQNAILSNKQRSAEIKYLNDKNLQLNEYQLIVLHQVNIKFNSIFTEILKRNYNYFLITGSKTDWNYLNSLGLGFSKKLTNQPQEIFSRYNPTFSSFQFDDLGFEDYPPLIDKFGTVDFEENKFKIMLSQVLQGIETGEPLMAVSQGNPKSGFLLGENIWRWRAKSYLDNKSFEEFDNFIGKLVQNLASKNRQERLTVDAENFYYANQNVIISAQYFDENYQFDAGRNLKISISTRGSEENFTSDLVVKNNYYQFNGGDLEPGTYSYKVTVEGEKVTKSGIFEVIAYNSEQQFVSSNLTGMQYLADNNETRLYYPDELEDLVSTLLADDKYKPIQKSRQKTLPLVDWYYLLFILIFILAVEWFYRKYLGLI